jgi:hypothetical protein
LVVQDLQKLQFVSQGQTEMVGSPVPIDGDTPKTVWEGLRTVHESVSSVASAVAVQASSLDALAADQTNLMHSVLALESQADAALSLSDIVSRLTVDLRALENWVIRLLPVLNQLKRGSSPATLLSAPNINQALALKVEACEQMLSSFRQTLTDLQDHPNSKSNIHSSSIDSRLREVQVQMKQLQLKVVGKGVQIANKTFQTFDDVKVWVDTNLPNQWYGLFVDGVSIFEFFTAGYIDAETTYSSFYSQHRTGFKSTYEARVASSV